MSTSKEYPTQPVTELDFLQSRDPGDETPGASIDSCAETIEQLQTMLRRAKNVIEEQGKQLKRERGGVVERFLGPVCSSGCC